MTEKEAIRILSPETTIQALAEIEYYAGFNGQKAKMKAVDEACVVAVKAMRKQEAQEAVCHDNCDNPCTSARCPRCFEIISNDYCGYCGQRVK